MFVWSTWNEMLIYAEHGRVWFSPLPSTHTLTAILLIIRDKKCWLLITPGWTCGMFEADTFVLSPDIKTHIWIRCDGCIITAMTSHPTDKTDGRQDSWQHGTKLVWAAVPSVVCCHDRGGSYYLHGCPPSLPGRIGLVLVSGGVVAAWVSWKWKDGLIRTEPLPLLSFLCPLWLGDWAYWLNFVHFSLKNGSVKEVYKSTRGHPWYKLAQIIEMQCCCFFK